MHHINQVSKEDNNAQSTMRCGPALPERRDSGGAGKGVEFIVVSGVSSGTEYEVGDQPNHWYGLAQFKCTATSGEVAGVKDKEGMGTEFHEVVGGKSGGHGIFVATMANGDHVHYTYTNSVNLTEGMMTTGSNKFEITGGTGKFKAIKGKGGCTGKGNADGSSTWTCTGTYTGVK